MPTARSDLRLAALTPDEIQRLAAELRSAELSRRPIAPLTTLIPGLDLADAYRIQIAGVEARVQKGARVVGRKAGITSVAMQRLLGVDEPDFGHLLDDWSGRATRRSQWAS